MQESMTLAIQICNSPNEAPNYNNIGGFKGAKLTKAIVVRNGTVNGNDTVDLQFEDDEGNKFIALVSGHNLKLLGNIINNHQPQGVYPNAN